MPPSKKRNHNNDSTSTGTKRRKKSNSDKVLKTIQDNSTFGRLVNEAGFVLTRPDINNQMSKKQALFRRDLEQLIRKKINIEDIVEEFIAGLTNHVDDIKQLFRSLMPTDMSDDAEENNGSQDPLMRLLLGIDSLQTPVMNLLLEKLATISEEECAEVVYHDQINIPQLILNQFHLLDTIQNGQQISEKMFEILSVVAPEVKRGIILTLPEVIEDCQHSAVASELRSLLSEEPGLSSAILDALSNLLLEDDILSQIRTSVIDSLPIVAVEELPILLKFLLQTTTADDAQQVMKDLRENLDFSALTSFSTSSQREKSEKRDFESLVVDALKLGIRFQRCVAEAWLKVIESVPNAAGHKELDLFVLFILHNNYKKQVDNLFKMKIRRGHFTNIFLHSVFKQHHGVLRGYFTAISNISESLLKSSEATLSRFAADLYTETFVAFGTYYQQEIVHSLVMHIGSGSVLEVDAALSILVDLVQRHSDKMAQFAIFIKGIIDYMDNLSSAQIRKLYLMLSVLSFQTDHGRTLIQDDLHILIRKQLSNKEAKYKRMGVIGSIKMVEAMSPARSGDSLSDSTYKKVVQVLQLVRTCSMQSPLVSALFMDELSTAVQRGDICSKVEKWINDEMIGDFQDDFIAEVDDNPNLDSDCALPMKTLYLLDDESESSIALRVLPLLCLNPRENDKRLVHLMCLAPHFRLLQVCETRSNNGDLENIDALLGCPILSADLTIVDKISSYSMRDQHIFCDSVFYMVNWFIETINAFALQLSAEMKVKITSRIHHITELLAILAKSIPAGYQPPMANFEVEQQKVHTTAPTAKPKKPKAKGKKKKGTVASTSEVTMNDDSDDDNATAMTMLDKTADSVPCTAVKLNKEATLNTNAYKLYFRELDLEVFRVLHDGDINSNVIVQTQDTKMIFHIYYLPDILLQLKLQSTQLIYLFGDLQQKLDRALPCTSNLKKNSFPGKFNKSNFGYSHLDQMSVSEVVEKVIKLLPALCHHLEETQNFYQILLDDNDGVIDGAGMFTAESALMAECYQLLLALLNTIFSWIGFSSDHNTDLLKEALLVFARRITENSSEELSLEEIIATVFSYMRKFRTTIPNLACAVQLVKLLITIAGKDDDEDDVYREKIGHVSGEFLKRQWYDDKGEIVKGAKCNELLQTLLSTHLCHCEDVLSSLENIVTKAIPDYLQSETSEEPIYPTLNKVSYPVFYRVSLSTLVDYVKRFDGNLSGSSEKDKVERLTQWRLAGNIFNVLVKLIQVADGQTNLYSLLKYSRGFLDYFVRYAMPLMDTMFRGHSDDVRELLWNIQKGTRQLHHACGHSKTIRNLTLTNLVPTLKKSLELFVFRVKAMLTVNKCHEAFWLGNLRHRDIKGKEIQEDVNNDSESDDDNPANKSDVSQAVDNHSDLESSSDNESVVSNDAQSYSEIF